MEFKKRKQKLPFLGGSKSRESASKALGTLGKCKVVEYLLPTPKCHPPPLYCMQIFVPDHVVAKSCFWCFVSQLKKRKKRCHPVFLRHCAQPTPSRP
uniref:Uncharacterized protein n=1 Tax=Suricata suricatta TaxID=37032 RepID=A0A673V1H9_SURSU